MLEDTEIMDISQQPHLASSNKKLVVYVCYNLHVQNNQHPDPPVRDNTQNHDVWAKTDDIIGIN